MQTDFDQSKIAQQEAEAKLKDSHGLEYENVTFQHQNELDLLQT